MSTKHEREAAQWERVAEMCLEMRIGICAGVGRVVEFSQMRFAMWRRIDGYMKDGTDWAYPVNDWGIPRDSDREARCLAALWLAEDARHGVPVIEVTAP